MFSEVVRQLRPAVFLLVAFSILTGLVYPLIVAGIASIAFPNAAAGSLMKKDGKPIGSRLIGQPFDDPRYFWGRPSATGPFPYNAGASRGSNLGPLNKRLETAIQERVAKLKSADPQQTAAPPVDLVTASGSGLDPHISPAAALYQARRVAAARSMKPERVEQLVQQHIEPRTLGVLGEPRVNVLLLNLALDGLGMTK